MKVGFARKIAERSALVAIVLGTIPEVMNDGAEVQAGDPVLWRLLLTYPVPLMDSTHGAFSALKDEGGVGCQACAGVFAPCTVCFLAGGGPRASES
ncbi:hypothetical protein SPHV1_1000009 [Novosphingobium sp. KN65.2]|nr:hypothetical protein SPHV1_1000009 [Novosphingobium sp. KN65.2]